MATSSRKPTQKPENDELKPDHEPVDEPRTDDAAERTDEPAAVRDGICVRCWPDGWPSEDTKSANCEHGVWSR